MAEQVNNQGPATPVVVKSKKKSKSDKRSTPISRFIRNEISASEYFRLTNQRAK